MFISVKHVGTGYSVTLLSTHGGLQAEVRFELAEDALDFAELWRDWVDVPSNQTSVGLGMKAHNRSRMKSIRTALPA